MKKVLISIFALAALAAFATPSITSVSAQAHRPWDGKVDIAYTVSGDIVGTAKQNALIASLKVTATDRDAGQTYTATSLSGDTGLANGTHSLVWDMSAQGLALASTNVEFAVSCDMTPAPYCVIDLSAGANASSYSVTYLASPPSGGFNVDVYKKTKLVLKRMEAGTFKMQGSSNVTLTKPFFIGIFEVTQKQYSLVIGSNPSNFSGDKLPMEKVTYNAIRGSSNGAGWPSSSAVDASSFLGKLRARTGLDFDLPTEAQWEYVCRAGTTTTYSYGSSANGNYMWYTDNSSSQTHEVGTKQPNPWGLYDMHGNVWEWCLDRYGALSYGTDPKGSSSGTHRVLRGGSWYRDASSCTSTFRFGNDPSYVHSSFGFRLAWPLATAPLATTYSRSSATISIPPQSSISFDRQGGTGGSASVTATYGSAMPTITVPMRTGYLFDGYYTSANGSGTQYYTASGTSARAWDGTSDTTLYAKWWRPDEPVITPAGGVVTGWPVSVSMSCDTEGATIHYTTDGTQPTETSMVYSRFRISGRTTVKAVAIMNGAVSEVAVARFAAGQCVDPVITPTDGTEFEHVGQQVSIAWSGADGILRYTTDGSDPTVESPVYSGPFSIDDSTVVKARAFGDQFFDSAIVTANLTRVWVNVATPVITAAASFTGSKTKVAISCATDGAAIRYTLNGNDPNSHASRYNGPFFVTDSCVVKAHAVCADYLDSAVATQSIEKVWGVGDTLGAPDHVFTNGVLPFVRVTDNTAPLGESMKSGAITDRQTSTLTTTVMGPGTITFQWKTSCEKDPDDLYEWDHAEFLMDGALVARLDGVTGWQTVSHAISGDVAHSLEWRYTKDDIEAAGDDCCWVADYRWASDYTATRTTEVPVPYTWLRTYYPETPDEYDFYEAAAKEDGANGRNKVWECYVAGLVPTNASEVLRTVILNWGGSPVISWEPRLSAAEEARRTYTIYGRESLVTGEWTTPTNSLHRFFRVKVTMP